MAGKTYNAAPIGYCSFALTLFIHSFYMSGSTVPITTYPQMAMGYALLYGGLIQFLAGLFELKNGKNYEAFVFCSYAGHWFGLSLLFSGSYFSPSTTIPDTSVQYKSLGVIYLAWTIFTMLMILASIRKNIVSIVFFSFLTIIYILYTASYFLLWDANLARAGGAIGIFTSCILWYLGFAHLLKKGVNSYFDLPLFNLSPVADDDDDSPVSRQAAKQP